MHIHLAGATVLERIWTAASVRVPIPYLLWMKGSLAAPTRHRMCHYHCLIASRNPSLLVPFYSLSILVLLAYIFLFALLAFLYTSPSYTTPKFGI